MKNGRFFSVVFLHPVHPFLPAKQKTPTDINKSTQLWIRIYSLWFEDNTMEIHLQKPRSGDLVISCEAEAKVKGTLGWGGREGWNRKNSSFFVPFLKRGDCGELHWSSHEFQSLTTIIITTIIIIINHYYCCYFYCYYNDNYYVSVLLLLLSFSSPIITTTTFTSFTKPPCVPVQITGAKEGLQKRGSTRWIVPWTSEIRLFQNFKHKNKESLLSDLKQVCLQAVTDHWQENFFIDLYCIFFSSTVFARLIKIQMCRHPGGRSCDFDTGFFFGDVVRVDAIGWLSKG